MTCNMRKSYHAVNEFLIFDYGKLTAMMDLHERLQAARRHAGFATAKDAAEALGISYPTYAGHENGQSGFRAPTVEIYARRFKVSYEWLMSGRGTMLGSSPRTATIVGRAGASTDGRIMYAESDGGLGAVLLPEGADTESVAVEIEGYSMGFLADGALIFYSETHSAPTDDMLGMIVIVGLEDGSVLLKRLLRGSDRGLYDLESINGPILRDQKVQWAAHIDSIVPPWRAKRLRTEITEVQL